VIKIEVGKLRRCVVEKVRREEWQTKDEGRWMIDLLPKALQLTTHSWQQTTYNGRHTTDNTQRT
jgi:hypothetical protein